MWIVRRSLYQIALAKHCGIHKVTPSVQLRGINGGPFDFDFAILPQYDYVKVFNVLDAAELAHYARHPNPGKVTYLLDGEQMSSLVTSKLENGITSCVLAPKAFDVAKKFKAYLYYDARIWSSHLDTNVWEALPSIEQRILTERDWNLTKPSPVPLHSIKAQPGLQP